MEDPQVHGSSGPAVGNDNVVTIDQSVANDTSVEDDTVDERKFRRLLGTKKLEQQDRLISSMTSLFSKSNGVVLTLVFIFWVGDFWRSPQIITDKVIMSLIGATVVQLGVAFLVVTRHFFPSSTRTT